MSLLTNLAAYWKLDESSGNAADSSGAGLTLTNNSATYGAGLINNGAIFAVTQYLSRTDQGGLPNNGDCSVSFWVKLNTEITSGLYVLFLAGTGSASGLFYDFRYNYNAGTPRLEIFITNDFSAPTNYNISLGTTNWHHVVVTRTSAGVIILYVNGANVGTSTDTSNGTQSVATSIGGQQASNTTLGVIDEFGIWSRVLTSGEVTSLYNSGAGLQYPFSSGNSNFFAFM